MADVPAGNGPGAGKPAQNSGLVEYARRGAQNQSMNKQLSAAQVAAELRDGMCIGIGGWGGRRKPMALVREILRSSLTELTVVAYGGPEIGMLCAAGKVRKLIYGFVSLDVIPLEAHFRKARQAGAVQVMELDEGMLQWGLRAAAMRLPFLPHRAGMGSDVLTVNPGIETVRSPYPDGETLVAVPALRLDAALLHVNRADVRGNSQLLGPDPFFDEWFARAAQRTWISCDELVDTADFGDPELARASMPIERSLVRGVVEAPWGAHPTSCAPRYGIDAAHLKEYSAAAKEADGWQKYYEQYISVPEAQYLQAVGGAERVAGLPLPVF